MPHCRYGFPMHVIVTGGAGFIGAHSVRALLQRGHRVSVVDDLSHGRQEAVPEGARLSVLDVREPALFRLFEYYPLLPTALREKAVALRHGGDIGAAYRQDAIVFHPSLADRTKASTSLLLRNADPW